MNPPHWTAQINGGFVRIGDVQRKALLDSCWLQILCRKAGSFRPDRGIESLRRTRAVAMYNRTGDMEAVRDLLGLKDIDAAEKYLSSYTR